MTLIINQSVQLSLDRKLTVDSTQLTVSASNEAYLLTLLPEEGDFMYLTITDRIGTEVVTVTNQAGFLLLTRALDGTQPRQFPAGSCVKGEITAGVVKYLICNYDCCETPCPTDPAEVAGVITPPAVVGNLWSGSVVFEGTTPFTFGVSGGMPDWIVASFGSNYVFLTGTPPAAGTYNFSVSATNGSGGSIVSADVSIVVQ